MNRLFILATMIFMLLQPKIINAETFSQSINMSIKVPSKSFYASTTGWDSSILTFQWDTRSRTLLPILTLPIIIKNSGGGMNVRISDGHITKLVPDVGITSIEYKIQFFNFDNPCTLTTSTEAYKTSCILSSATLSNERQGWINIIPIQPSYGWPTGSYLGKLQLIFEGTP